MATILNTLATAAVACGVACTVSTSALAASPSALAGLEAAAPQSMMIDVRGRHYRHHHHGGRNVGLAILGAAAATAIIAGSARADRGYYRGGRGDRCGYYDDRCSRGERWACRKFDNYCD